MVPPAVVESDAAEALSLRGIVQTFGVTHSALYRHFASRDALAAAVASRGFDELFEGMKAAALQGDAPGRAERAMTAYIAFTIDHRNLYRLMFSFPAQTLVAESDPGPQVKAVIALVAEAFRRPGDPSVYMKLAQDMSDALSRVRAAVGDVLLQKTLIAPGKGYWALFSDAEGNRLALHSMQ